MRPKKPRHKKKLPKQQIELLCGEVGPDDGVDPRHVRHDFPRKQGGRKTLQLCKQVERTLSQVFAGDCGDPVLHDLSVAAVEPAPNSARLLVTLCLHAAPGMTDPREVEAHLAQASGKLRSEVAAAIHRKKAPELAFCVVAPGPRQ
jgi:ribosome-binding factor A